MLKYWPYLNVNNILPELSTMALISAPYLSEIKSIIILSASQIKPPSVLFDDFSWLSVESYQNIIKSLFGKPSKQDS